MLTLSDEFIARLYELPLSNRWHELITNIERQSGAAYSVLGLFLTSQGGEQTRRGAVLASQPGHDRFRADLDEFNLNGTSAITAKARTSKAGDTFNLSDLCNDGVAYAPDMLDMIGNHGFSDNHSTLVELSNNVRISLNQYQERGRSLEVATTRENLTSIAFHLSRSIGLVGRMRDPSNLLGSIFGLARSATPFWLVRPHDCSIVVSNTRNELPFSRLPNHVLTTVRGGRSAHAVSNVRGVRTAFKVSLAPVTDDAGIKVTVERELFLVTPEDLPTPAAAFIEAYMTLSNQERRLIDRLAQGQSEATISAALKISDNTLRYHRKNAYSKLQITSKAELAILVSRYL